MDTHTNLIHVSDQDFETKVLKSTAPVIVDFWAPWCGPCRAIAPVFEKLSDEYQGKLLFAKLNTDENMNTSARLGVQAIPTLIIFHGGKVIARIVGAANPGGLKREIDRTLAANGIAIA